MVAVAQWSSAHVGFPSSQKPGVWIPTGQLRAATDAIGTCPIRDLR